MKDINAIVGGSGSISAGVYKYLVKKSIIAGIGSGPGLVIGTAVTLKIANMNIAENGCGVVYELYFVDPYGINRYEAEFPINYVRSQEHV